jgi:hypothetical protein
MMIRIFLALWAIAGVSGCIAAPRDAAVKAGDGTIQFALVGDNPYVDFNVPKYETMIGAINRTPDLAWVVHVGDLKGGGQSCADDELAYRFKLNSLIQLPFILTPGDNDWFDCSRKTAGGFDAMERLTALRRMFFPVAGKTGGVHPFAVTSQAGAFGYPDFVENVYWIRNDVMFATVHIIGVSPGEAGAELHEQVLNAGLAWLDTVFAAAVAMDVKGLFIATQADPYLFSGLRPLIRAACPLCPWVRPGYGKLDEALRLQSKRFARPILFAVGDTHVFRVDKPLYDGDDLVLNFTRVEVFGHPNVHWVRIVVDPASPEVFAIHQELVPENFGVGWQTE